MSHNLPPNTTNQPGQVRTENSAVHGLGAQAKQFAANTLNSAAQKLNTNPQHQYQTGPHLTEGLKERPINTQLPTQYQTDPRQMLPQGGRDAVFVADHINLSGGQRTAQYNQGYT